LGDYPNVKFQRFAQALPQDLSGKTVLDIGCNAGFYSIEMKRRGAARVVGIDSDERYLAQARFAADVLGAEIEFQNRSVYEVAGLRERFDIVIFMGVLYHLRHPLLALDLLYDTVVKDVLIFQSMQRGSADVEPLEKITISGKRIYSTSPHFPKCFLSNTDIRRTPPTGGYRTAPVWKPCCAVPVFK
jgi:tRNA (mo5U34)-methyltransferase